LKRANFLVFTTPIFITILSIAGCAFAPEKCKTIQNRVVILDWDDNIPKSAILYRYRKDSNFKDLQQVSVNNFQATIDSSKKNKTPTLLLKFLDYSGFALDSDYKLIVDNKIEYKISDIEPGDLAKGCGIPAGKVNQCKINYNNSFSFQKKCSVDVSH
jgi:hypothetical protein